LKTGLYTGPHLVDPEERIRINFKPLSKSVFADYIFEVHGNLAASPITPRYLQLLTLISFHAFIEAGVDVAIYETHHGGEYDATNFVPKPAVTAITVIDYDHIDTLGTSLERIAWHKAGILKYNVPAFSAMQQPAAADALRERALEKGTVLEFVQPLSHLPPALQPRPDVQLQNFSLAHAVCNKFLSQTPWGPELSPDDVIRCLKSFSWPGRFQTIASDGITWYLDGAHNDLSLNRCAQWFADTNKYAVVIYQEQTQLTVNRAGFNILIFGHTSSRDRSSLIKALALPLVNCGIKIQHVILTDCPSAQKGSPGMLDRIL
jgi:folylpolyglutamate synthase